MADQTSGDPVARANITTDALGWFKAVSPAFLALIGKPVEALAGLNLTDLIHPSDSAATRQLLAHADSLDPVSKISVRLFVSGEEWMPMALSIQRVEQGRITIDLRAVETTAATEPDPSRIPAPTPSTSASSALTTSPAHRDYLDLLPADDVADQRAAIRSSAGDATTPMIEIDHQDRTVFVAGPWLAASDHGADGADAFEEVLVASGQADEIMRAVDSARLSADSHEFSLPIRAGSTTARWLQVRPIPSPHLADVMHALISVSDAAGITAVRGLTLQPRQPATDAVFPLAAVAPTDVSGQPADDVADVGQRAEPAAEPDGAEPAAEPDGAEPDGAEPAAEPDGAEPDAERDGAERAEPAAEPDGAVPDAGDRAASAVADSAQTDLAASSTEAPRGLWAFAMFSTYVAMQGLYLGPALGWPSPLRGLLDSQRCLIQPLCDNNVLRFNHLAVIALLIAIASFAVLFRRIGPPHLETGRPAAPGDLSATIWKPTINGPGLFGWLSVFAVLVITAQTLFAEVVSTKVWIAATMFGAIAAWRSDRDGTRPLASTMSALALALSCVLVPLGVGSFWLGERRLFGVVLIVVGFAIFARAQKLIAGSSSSFDTVDYAAMLGFALLALILGLARHHSWRYAFIGDEWSFFEGALDSRRGNARLATFDIGGPNDYFTGLTFELQAFVMRVAGDDVWGWRLSAMLPMVVSVPAMYAFTRWLAGRTAAMAAAIALATGHMLLSFSMIGYNNSQSLVAVSASFAALAWAQQRPSALRFFVLGSAVGSTFLVYAMARLALVPIGLLFLFLFRDNLASFARRLGWATLGGLAMAAPALFSWQNWEALLKATPVQAEDPVLQAGGVTRQVVENTFAGWLSFIGSARNTHFIVGPHLDLISAVLLIIGLGYVISRSRGDLVMRWFLVGGLFLWTAINAVQQYAQISNTRSFMIPLVYCVFIGIGARVMLPIVIRRLKINAGPLLGIGSLVVFALMLIGLNQWHIGSYANDRQQLTEQALLVQQFEFTESIDGNGMQVVVGWPEERNARLNMILRAHDIAAERIVTIPTNGSLNQEALCAKTEPAMLLMHHRHPRANEWVDAMAECWNYPVTAVADPSGALKLLRAVNRAGAAEYDLNPSQRFVRNAAINDFELADTIDIATDGAGTAFALTRSDDDAQIHRLDGGGSFDLTQRDVIDFDITSEGLFVVAANGGDDRLVWYDGRGNIVHRYGGQDEIPVIGGISVDDDLLWASITDQGVVVSFDASFKLVESRSAGGSLVEPASIAAGADGAVWVFSARTGEVVLIDIEDRVVIRLPAQIFSPADAPRLSATDAGLLIRSVREHPEVQLVTTVGEVIDARGGINGPRGAATRNGELIIADPRWHDVPVLAVDDRWTPDERGTIAWDVRSLVANSLSVFDSPFFSDELFSAGPLTVELIETETHVTADDQTYRAVGVPGFGEVHGIATTSRGAYVADVFGRVVRLDENGAATNVAATASSGSTYVTDLAVGDAEIAWVLDAGQGRLVRVDPDGNVVPVGTDPGPLVNARGIGAGNNDTVWVASTAAAQLTQVAADGAIVSVLPLPGRQPSDVVQLDDDTIWIVDSQEFELVHLNSAGETLRTIGLASFTSIDSPHLSLAGETMWVTDPEMSAVFAVDLTTDQLSGERIDLVRPDGSPVVKPIGVAVAPDGRIWVTDSTGGATIVLG